MASINGIEIKKLKTFRDHEGIPIAQGEIYYKGKNLGFWSQDAWGGCDNYGFDKSVLNQEVEKYKMSNLCEEQFRELTDLDILLYDLLTIIESEKSYKRGVKKGYTTFVEIKDFARSGGFYSNVINEKTIKKYSDEWEAKFGRTPTVTVDTSLNDFNITV